MYVPLKFGIDTEYEKIEIFRSAVEQYLKDRPREWLSFVGFRPTDVASDRGYIGKLPLVRLTPYVQRESICFRMYPAPSRTIVPFRL